MDLLEEQGIIHVDTLTESTCLTIESPKDMRDNVVFELLSTERKYVQDLETLQVGYSRPTFLSSCKKKLILLL